jgi:4a-hydroxytetrahydrobiopterin dehydratase
MTPKLEDQKCQPCEKGELPLRGEALKQLQAQLSDGWAVVGEKQLEKEYTFKNFRDALAFTNRVGEIAEKENHHPDVFLSWGKVRLNISTHSIGGLSANDFILAAKADAVK